MFHVRAREKSLLPLSCKFRCLLLLAKYPSVMPPPAFFNFGGPSSSRQRGECGLCHPTGPLLPRLGPQPRVTLPLVMQRRCDDRSVADSSVLGGIELVGKPCGGGPLLPLLPTSNLSELEEWEASKNRRLPCPPASNKLLFSLKHGKPLFIPYSFPSTFSSSPSILLLRLSLLLSSFLPPPLPSPAHLL